MKRFSEFLNESQLLTEMARVGFLDKLEICVYTDDPRNVPHVHIRDVATRGKLFDACVKLEYPEYFDHGCHTDTLNSKQKRELDKFMNSAPAKGVFKTNYEKAVYMWNDNNSNKDVEFEYYDDGRVIVPDYTTLH
jgi:hypothetical protein